MSDDMSRLPKDASTNTPEDIAEMLRGIPQEPDEIDVRLRDSVRPALTREEIREQKISFVMGMMSERSTMTREEVAELLDSQYG